MATNSILAPLVYYDLLDKPLAALEVFKYLPADSSEISFFDMWRRLKTLAAPGGALRQKHGLYFLPGREEILNIRQKRLKIAQTKWKKIKKIGKYLALSPFLRLAAVTGSLTACNTKEQSDFDLLIVIKKNRLWLGRLLLTGLIGTLGKRRHGNLTRNRICLNCYLTQDNLEITEQVKPRDWHTAQEYGRLTPLLELEPKIYEKFIHANLWLAGFLKNYPWPNSRGAKQIKPLAFFTAFRQGSEWLLSSKVGDWIEKIVKKWQTKRIRRKRQSEPANKANQIYISDHCLMFHPQSKSEKIMREFEEKMKK